VSREPRKPKPPKLPFDIIRASFWLVAFVFGLYGVITLVAIVVCSWHLPLITDAGGKCIAEGGVGQVLGTLLASALAFAAGRSMPPPKE
jgi:hypothetical protein